MIRYSQNQGLYVIATSPINIALVKYWGKVDEDLIIPTNSSISLTIDQNDLCSRTMIQIFDNTCTTNLDLQQQQEEVAIILNGKPERVSTRVKHILDILRGRIAERIEATNEQGETLSFKREEIANMKIRISSENNFATASGLASSSSGLSCLTYALAKLYGVEELYEGEYSKFARMGSGSACRSLYGGLVQWYCGFENKDEVSTNISAINERSIAWPINYDHGTMEKWIDELSIIICVVKPEKEQQLKKEVPSTDGMKLSLKTSELMRLRLESKVPQTNIDKIIKAFESHDFQSFSEITMKESNQLHAICLDTYPPIFYMNETSRQIVKAVTQINSSSPQNKVAYSIDAGIHVFLFMKKGDVEEVQSHLSSIEGIDKLIHTRIGKEGVKILDK